MYGGIYKKEQVEKDEGTARIMYKGTNRGGIADWVWLKRNGEKELDRAMDEDEWMEV